MKKRICGFAVVLLLLMSALAAPAYASVDAQTVEIPVEIVLEGPVLDSVDTFTVELSTDEADSPLPMGGSGGVYQEDIIGAGPATLTIEYTELGVYSYTLRQLKGDNGECTYDETKYALTVYITRGEAGEIESTVILKDPDGEKLDTAVFTNVYAEPEPVKLDPPVEKKVEVKRGKAPDNVVFTFAMIPSEPDAPMPDNEEAKKDETTGALTMDKNGPGSYEFGWMTFDVDDVGKTYTYTLKEVPGAERNFTYDPEIYTMTVTVSAKDRKLVLDVVYNRSDGETADHAVFTNIYTAPDNGGGKLLPTGQLNWPIPVLCGLGVVLIAVGLLSSRRKKDGTS